MIKSFSKIMAVIMTALVTTSTGLVATSAQAADKPSQSELRHTHTRVVIAPPVARQFERDGVNIRAYGGAFAYLHAGSAAVHFPIVRRTRNSVRHDGTVAFRKGGERVSLRNLRINTNRGLVNAVVNGGDRDAVLRLTPSKSQLGDTRLTFTFAGARAFNQALGTRFLRGDKFAFANVAAGS